MKVEIVNWDKYNPRSDAKAWSWYRMQNDFLEDPDFDDLSAADLLVFVFLCGRRCKAGTSIFKISVKQAADRARCEPNAVQSALRQLETTGKIKIHDWVPYGSVRERTLGGMEAYPTDGRTDVTDVTDERHQAPSAQLSLVEESKTKKTVYKFDVTEMKAATWFQRQIKLVNPGARNVDKANLDQWAHEIRLLREYLKVEMTDVAALMQFALEDPFWSTNIQSPTSLRKHWDQLTAKMRRPAQLIGEGGGYR